MGWRRIFVAAVFAVLGSCTTAVQTSTDPANGVPYYLPRSLLELTFTPGTTPTIVPKPVEIADARQRYVARYIASPFADDRICVSRSKTGLLDKIYFSADDRTDDILLNVVQLVASVSQAPEGPGKSKALTAKTGGPVTMLIDPFDPVQIAAFNKRIRPYRVDLPTIPSKSIPEFTCPQDSVCFATRITIPIRLSVKGNLVDQKTLDVVDPFNYGSMDVSRALMTARFTKLDFDGGVLTSVRIRKDSEALAASEFPLKAIERVLAVPGNSVALAMASYDQKLAYLQHRKALQDAGAKSETASQPVTLLDIDTCLKPPG